MIKNVARNLIDAIAAAELAAAADLAARVRGDAYKNVAAE